MSSTPPECATPVLPTAGKRWARATLLLIVGVTLLRVAYLFLLCPYQLVEDEAAYWVWSRHLDWSYHTKGPGIALAIRVATALLGESEAAIRMVAVDSSALAALGVALLAAQAGRSARGGAADRPNWHAGFIAAALFLLIPAFQAVGLFATIDGPYVAFWAVGALGAYMGIERRAPWGWVLLGGAVGVGFLFKYTILLLLPGVAYFAIVRRRGLGTARARLAALGGLVLMLAGFAPVVVWNAQRGWPTVAHLLGHLGVAGGDMPAPPRDQQGWSYNPLWTLDYLITQIGFVGPALVLAAGAAVIAYRRRRTEPEAWPARLFLIACALPVLVFYLLVSFKTEPEANWAMGGYVTLVPLAALAIVDALPLARARLAMWRRLPEPRPKAGFLRRRPEVFAQVLWHWSIVYGVIAALGLARADLLARLAPAASGRISSLLNARELALDAAARADQLTRATGREAFYIVQHYGRASILTYYIPGHPNVRCSSSRMGGRMTPFDYWASTSLDDPSLRGRAAVLLGAEAGQWTPVFERVEPIGRLRGEHKKDREAFLGYGYKGWVH